MAGSTYFLKRASNGDATAHPQLQDPLDTIIIEPMLVMAKPRAVAAAAAAAGGTLLSMTPIDGLEAAAERLREQRQPRLVVTPLATAVATETAQKATVEARQATETPGSQDDSEPEITLTWHHDDELPAQWEEFEQLGFPAPQPQRNAASKLLVSTYKLIGFGILTMIVFVLVGYIATTAFYFFNRTWITPVAISPSDEKVVALRGELAAQQNQRDKLVEDLDQADRVIAAEQGFQREFATAIRHDLEGRLVALGRVRELATEAGATRDEIRRTNTDYASSSQQRASDEYAAGLIDRNAMLSSKYQLAQITSSNLTLAERQSEFEQRAAELGSETRSLDAILASKGNKIALSYDVLKIKRELETSKLELAKDIESRERLRASIARQDEILDGVRRSAYLRALADRATVALVPYSNLDHIAKGTPLYGCKLAMVICHQVGTVLEVLPGEVQVKQPHRDSTVRGQMIELRLDDADASKDEVLFAGSKPLLL